MVIGVASFFMMPASAVQTKSWLRPKGWFTDRETAICVNRVLRDDPSKGIELFNQFKVLCPFILILKLGDMDNRTGLTPKAIWNAMMDYDMWPVSSN